MRIPNADHAMIDIAKLQDYCLDESHPRGKHKAKVFAAVLGMTTAHAWTLRKMILDAVKVSDLAREGESDEFGRRFVLDVNVDGPKGSAEVRTAWIIRINEDFPRLVSAYVL